MEKISIAVILSDEEDIRKYFSRLVGKIGVSFIIEKDILKAIDHILHFDVKVIILDLKLLLPNKMEYVQVIKRIRPRLPIIAINKDFSPELQNQLVNNGINYYFVKPWAEEEIKNKVKELLEI